MESDISKSFTTSHHLEANKTGARIIIIIFTLKIIESITNWKLRVNSDNRKEGEYLDTDLVVALGTPELLEPLLHDHLLRSTTDRTAIFNSPPANSYPSTRSSTILEPI